METEIKYRVLFICLGNICRSPIAETIFLKQLTDRDLLSYFDVDSAGLEAYHEGDRADARMRQHAIRRGYDISHISRPMRKGDWDNFDYIICMDSQNMRALTNRAPSDDYMQKVNLATNYCTDFILAHEVPDPYYGGEEGFEYVIDLLEDACRGLIDKLIESIQS